jgi:hypothetical protein
MLNRIREDERGIALVVAMLVMMVMVSLSIAVVQIAQGENFRSSSDRKTVEAADVVDTALANYLTVLPTSAGADLCTTWDAATRLANSLPANITLSNPGGSPLSYRLDISFTTNSGATVACFAFTGAETLTSATITATGYAGTSTKNSAQVARKFVMKANLTPVVTPGIDQAVYGASNVTLAGKKTIMDDPTNPATNDATVYSGCTMDMTNGAGSSLFQGSLVQACGPEYRSSGGNTLASIKSGADAEMNLASGYYLQGQIWGKGDIVIGASCIGQDSVTGASTCGGGPSTPDDNVGWVVSTKGSEALSNLWSHQACVAPQGSIWKVGGGPNCLQKDWTGGAAINWTFPSSPDSGGTGPPAYYPSPDACPATSVFLMGKNLCTDPPVITFPTWSYNAADWSAYTNKVLGTSLAGATNLDKCNTAKANIESGTAYVTPTLLDLRGLDCVLQFTANATINANLAIITDGSVDFKGVTWTGTGATQVTIIHPTTETGTLDHCDYSNGTGTPLYGADAQDDITFENLTAFNGIKAFFYTPCHIDMANSNEFDGQVIGGSVTTSNQGNIAFRKILVPGMGSPVGYSPAVQYQQEIPHF